MTFTWDAAKNILNLRKHGLDFADAGKIFRAPMLTTPDTRFDYGEDRYVGIGLLENLVVVVIFTEPEQDVIRLISLRKAVKHERIRYEQSLKDRLG